ncbi:MAG: ATP-binding protein [Burkholderiales bacterium]
MNAGLSALVVHDLKNRLAVHAQRIAETLDAYPSLDASLRPLRVDADALQRRLITFLTLYRADTGTLCATEEEADPARVLGEAARFAEALGARRGLAVEVDASRAPASWFLDAYLVGVALEAAVDNATRFAASRLRLVAETRRDGDAETLVLAIEDDGPGPGGAPAPDTDGAGSTGLGHELCRMVARLHRSGGRVGEVSLARRAAAGGARFEMRLP